MSRGMRYYVVAGGGVLLSLVAWCLLVTHSRVGNLLTFLAGALLGILSLCGATILALFYVSESAPPLLMTATTSLGNEPGMKDASASFGVESDSVEEPFMDEARKKELRSIVIQELLQTSKRKGPPHQLSQHGEYSGWVWTMPENRYDKTEALLNWPPATEGPKAAAIKWFGGLKAGRIFLARQTTLEDSDVVPVVEIPLAGCSVRLVTEGLRGKTRWWRKTPLEISHPSRALLARQKTFFLFCDGSAAKEQWLTALSWACSGGGAPQAVQDLYTIFCSALRDNNRLSFPHQAQSQADQHGESEAANEGHQGADGAASPSKKRSLFKRGWGAGRKSNNEKKVKPNKSKLSEGSTALPQKSSAFLNPEDLDKLWMEAPKSKPAKQHQQPMLSKQGSLEKGHSHEGLLGHAGDSTDDTAAASLPGSPLHTGHSHDTAGGLEADDLAHHSGDSEASLDSPMSQHGTHQNLTGSWHSESAGQPVSIPIEHAINMLLARVAFDLLRSPKFKQQVVAHIQKKLDELKVPDYINALQVVDVDLGTGVPHIRNLQALASPTATIWPQAVFDLDFTGDIKLVIAAKVDVRDGTAWSSLDKYIKNIEGTAAGTPALQSHSSDHEAAGPATAAAVADKDEDVDVLPEGGTVEPGTIPSSAPAADPTKKLGRVSQFLGKLQLRKRVAGGIRQLAEQTAQSISKMELKLSMDIKTLRGPLCVWLPPPPGDRMWFSFLEPPQLQVTASPLVAGRMVKYSYYIARISSFIASKMQSSVTKNLVFPSCGDIRILQLMSLEDADVTSPIPALVASSLAGVTAAAGKEPAKHDESAPAEKEVRRSYGRSTSAGGTTTVATPAPHSAASALAGAAKGQGQAPTAPVHTSALSASLAGTAQLSSPLKDPSGSSGLTTQLQAQQAAHAEAVADKQQGSVRTAGADPNDPTLYGLSDEPSGHSLGGTPHVSPRGPPSLTHGTSFSSTHGSPASRPALEENDSFSRHVTAGQDRSSHEGVELGIMGSPSQSLGEELLAQQLHSFAPTTAPQPGTAVPAPNPAHVDPPASLHAHANATAGPGSADTSAHQKPVAEQAIDIAADADDVLQRGAQNQPVSFQSLAALASSHASKARRDSAPLEAAGTTAGSAERQTEEQAPASQPVPSGDRSDRAGPGEGSLPEGSATPLGVPNSSTGADEKLGMAAEQARPSSSNRPAVLGRSLSEKKWAYPVPTGSPMFERVRSRNRDQGPAAASTADSLQSGSPQAPADDAGAREQEQRPAPSDRLDDRPQQAALLTTAPAGEAIVYGAPPTGPPPSPGVATEGASHDMLIAHHQTGSEGYTAATKGTSGMAGGGSGSAAQPGPSSPSVQQSALPDEAAGSSTAPPKGWFGQQLKGNSALASKVWDSKRDDIQQKGRKLASNVMGSLSRAEEKWRQSREPRK